MQFEFTYYFADIRESLMPERFAATPEKYGRRWIRPTLTWLGAGLAWSIAVWESGWLPDPWSAASRDLPHDLRIELLPALVAAFYVCALYALAIWNTWRSANSDTATSSWGLRIARMVIGGVCALGLWLAISHTWDPIWFPTRKQLVAVTVAPWLVLIIMMQALGVLQRRAKALGLWRSNPALQRPQTMRLDESGFRMYDARHRSEAEWAYFRQVRETKNLLVFISEGGARYVLPKRAFNNPADLERCRSLLQNVVPDTRFLVRPIGFAVMPNPVLPLPAIPTPAASSTSLTKLPDAGTMQPVSETELQQ